MFLSAVLSASQPAAVTQIRSQLDSLGQQQSGAAAFVASQLRDVLEALGTLPEISAALQKLTDGVDELVLGRV